MPASQPDLTESFSGICLAAPAEALSREINAPVTLPPRRIVVVECARGFAAIYVLVHHLVQFAIPATAFPGLNYWLHVFAYGHLAVLLFFLLSGFSIHYSHYRRPLASIPNYVDFFYLRLRRIYPLLVIAVGLTIILLVVGWELAFPTWGTFLFQLSPLRLLATFLCLAHLTDGGTFWYTTLPANPPLWSLAYEVPYYLAYPLFWRFSKSFGIERAFLVSVLIGAGSVCVGCLGLNNHLISLLSLYWLWCAGALFAEWRANGRTWEVSSLGYFGIVYILAVSSEFLEKTGLPILANCAYGAVMSLVMGFYCIRLTRGTPLTKFAGLLALGVLAGIGTGLAESLKMPGSQMLLEARIVLGFFFVAAFFVGIFNLRSVCTGFLSPFYKAGSWSYGLYIIHYPILVFVTSLLVQIHYPRFFCFAVIPLVLMLAAFLELGVQPLVAGWMDANIRPKRRDK